MPRPTMPPPYPDFEPKERCFPKWEQQCTGKKDDRVRCIVKIKRHCKKIRAKDCRIVPEEIEREFEVSTLKKVSLHFVIQSNPHSCVYIYTH